MNFGTIITLFGVIVEKIWRFEVYRAKLEFWSGSRGIL
jgi:hypothetical protein